MFTREHYDQACAAIRLAEGYSGERMHVEIEGSMSTFEMPLIVAIEHPELAMSLVAQSEMVVAILMTRQGITMPVAQGEATS